MDSDRCVGADTSHTKTDDFAPNDSYEIGHNELIIFGDSRNDESSLMNSVLMEMLENPTDNERNSKKSSEAVDSAIPIRKKSTEAGRDASKKALKKSTSKKRSSQSNLFKPVSGQKRGSKTPIAISTVLQDMVQKKKELTLSEIDGITTDRESGKLKKREDSHQHLTNSSKHIALNRADSASSRNLNSGMRSNLKDSEFFQSYLNTKNSKFCLEEAKVLQDRTDLTFLREANLINTEQLGTLAFDLRVNIYDKKQTKQPQKSVHPTLLSVISSIDQHETQKNFIQEKMCSEQKHRLVKAGSESDAGLVSKRVLATKPQEEPVQTPDCLPLAPKSSKRLSAANSQSKKHTSKNKENKQAREDSTPSIVAGASQDKPPLRRRDAKTSTNTLDSIFKSKTSTTTTTINRCI